MNDSGFPDIDGGFAFIGTLLDVRLDLPLNIGERVRLERATDSQIVEIKRLLPAGGGLSLTYHYEHDWVPVTTQTGTGHETRPLPRDDWRYFVFTWAGSNSHVNDVQRAVNLVPPPVSCVLQAFTRQRFGQGECKGFSVETVAAHYQHTDIPPKAVVVDAERIDLWRITCDRLREFDREQHSGIHRAVELLDQIRRFPAFGHLKVLTYFMALEMLLTHKPTEKEVGDSLAHQIRTKVALLSRRLPGGLDYSVFGVDVSEEKIWSKLYAYRSIVAHGEVPDFARELKMLVSPQIAQTFVATATAKLGRYALDDPQLIEGLKSI
jgi:hypothetical protein